ncbi:hypothetical protein H7198_01710 [Fructobacillus sp. CRL 2054]|uniref:hypothetical protein n=1 Tax=Fructobacillus sp. CRL 2054 TaxID=2763007 RepID=UPI0023791525|nr:hypothetical protein [Fructobacillus sp. CRL 2054]MDD9138329.1 hypothetical protein [Fructobacillus sp. CRL 2054]
MKVYQDTDGCEYIIYEYNSILGIWHITNRLSGETLVGNRQKVDQFIAEKGLTEVVD